MLYTLCIILILVASILIILGVLYYHPSLYNKKERFPVLLMASFTKGVNDMVFVYAFLVCGGISLAGQLLYDHTKLTAGHITSLFVAIGAALDTFGIYDWLLKVAGMGASLQMCIRDRRICVNRNRQ